MFKLTAMIAVFYISGAKTINKCCYIYYSSKNFIIILVKTHINMHVNNMHHNFKALLANKYSYQVLKIILNLVIVNLR